MKQFEGQGAPWVPVATDANFKIEWNPAAVNEYRLFGYETRGLAREDFNNDAVDAGEAGHQVTVIYEVVPADGTGWNDQLRYQGADAQPDVLRSRSGQSDELAFLKLR